MKKHGMINDEQENRFIHLYDDTGLKLRFEDKEDLFIMVDIAG